MSNIQKFREQIKQMKESENKKNPVVAEEKVIGNMQLEKRISDYYYAFQNKKKYSSVFLSSKIILQDKKMIETGLFLTYNFKGEQIKELFDIEEDFDTLNDVIHDKIFRFNLEDFKYKAYKFSIDKVRITESMRFDKYILPEILGIFKFYYDDYNNYGIFKFTNFKDLFQNEKFIEMMQDYDFHKNTNVHYKGIRFSDEEEINKNDELKEFIDDLDV